MFNHRKFGRATFAELMNTKQKKLQSILEQKGISKEVASDVLASGYFAWNMLKSFSGETEPCVYDGLYGNKSPSSLIPIETFCDYLMGKSLGYRAPATPTKVIRSLKDAQAILLEPQHARNRDRICFRGQSREYELARKIPNPFAANDLGNERLIIPSIYRDSFKPGADPNMRPYNVGSSLLRTAYDLIYDGIDWRTLADRNFKKYGYHDISGSASFPDGENQEYYRRRTTHEEVTALDHILLEQHYGLDTHGLDVTFDLATALFFATHDFCSNLDGTFTFSPRDSVKGAVVYCIVYESPSVRESSALIKETKIFSHIPPLRPIRQRCALPMFLADKVNETARDLDLIMTLDDPFDFSNLPKREWLFPSPSEDPFYKGLLKEKEKRSEDFGKIIEYRWT